MSADAGAADFRDGKIAGRQDVKSVMSASNMASSLCSAARSACSFDGPSRPETTISAAASMFGAVAIPSSRVMAAIFG